MWGYGINGIAQVALRCKSCKTLAGIDSYATSWDKFTSDPYMHYTSDTIAAHAAIKGIVHVGIRFNTIFQQTLHYLNETN
jgi:hypothetical protein